VMDREEASPAEEEQFLKMISHAQGGRMEEQRCSLQPSRSTPATPMHNGIALNSVPTASSQGRRLDDQRVALPTLPGIRGNSEIKENGRNAMTCLSIPNGLCRAWLPQSPTQICFIYHCNRISEESKFPSTGKLFTSNITVF
uniref:Uncharacterized protein n=1 Tax=Sander lucioperca TaxID=283035 RepID=A0A8C9YXZ4_SANLU